MNKPPLIKSPKEKQTSNRTKLDQVFTKFFIEHLALMSNALYPGPIHCDCTNRLLDRSVLHKEEGKNQIVILNLQVNGLSATVPKH